MPMPKELFDVVEFARVFTILHLRSSYHKLPLLEVDQVKTTFLEVDQDGKDELYDWKCLLFRLKNAPPEFQRVIDHV